MAVGAARERAVDNPASTAWRRADERLRALPWADIGAAAGMVAAWRGATWLFALLASYLGPGVYPPGSPAEFFTRALAQGEALWHVWIGERGYYFAGADPSTAAFTPLYALLIGAVVPFVPSRIAAGAIVSHAALVAALASLIALARLDCDRPAALRAAAAVLLWPAAFFLGTVAPESTLLLAVTAALYHARQGQWWAAAVWGGLAGVARGTGLLVVLPLLVEAWTQTRGQTARDRLRGLLPLGLVPLPFLGFLAYLEWRTGALRAYFLAQEALDHGAILDRRGPDTARALINWARGFGPLDAGYPPSIPFALQDFPALVDLAAYALFATLGLWLLLRVRVSYGLFVLAGAAAMFTVWGLPGGARHLMMLAPAFIALASWTRREAAACIAATFGALFLALTAFAYVNGFWAG